MMKPTLLLSVLLAVLAPAGAMARPSASAAQPVAVELLAFNDFHGNLEPPRQSVAVPDGRGGFAPVPAGGAAWLAATLDALRAGHANTLTVAAGDLIGASPLASALFLDEPTISVMNRLGLEFSAVGNHEFDRGVDELKRMQAGGCARFTRRTPCALEPFAGARFTYLAASTRDAAGQAIFPGTALKRFGTGHRRVTIGLIGLTLRATPRMVSPDGVKGLRFADEAETINAAVPALKAAGADAIVVLIHQGGEQQAGAVDPNGCAGFSGEIRPILDRLSPAVDVVVSGHTHRAYVCDYGRLNPAHPLLLTSAGNYGVLVTDIHLLLDPLHHRVAQASARNVVVQSEAYASARGPVAPSDLAPRLAPRADIAAYVGRYVGAVRAVAGRTVGHVAGLAEAGAFGGALGNLIADAQLAATRPAGAEIAFTNPGGIRTPALVPGPDHGLTFAQLFAVQPFGNRLVTGTLSGAEIRALLEQGVAREGKPAALIASAGFAYAFDPARPVGQRLVSATLNGHALEPGREYRVTVNSFLAAGGDGFAGFAHARDPAMGMEDVDALEAWLAADPPRAVPTETRISLVPPPG